MDWFPVIFIAFKILVLGTGMFFAVKWHYDQGRKRGREQQRAVLRAGGKMVGVFALLLVGLSILTFGLSRMLGLDLTLP